jgi:hypothetical protein
MTRTHLGQQTLVGPISAFALLAIECQTLTGAHERSLTPEFGTDGGPSGGSGGGASGTGASGGTEGSSGAGASGGTGASGGDAGAGGSAAGSANGGTAPSDAGGDAGNGGTDPDASTPTCAQRYEDWFQSTFATADSTVVGTADYPTMPWSTSGDMKLQAGRLSGAGTAIASQGLSFGYDGLRLRFKARFTDSSQQVKVALNAHDDGSKGLVLGVSASGRVVLLENDVERASATLNPLAIDRDWFVQCTVQDSTATVRISDTNYQEPASSPRPAAIERATVSQTAVGKQIAIALISAGNLPVAVDELFVSRCGLSPPVYQPIFRDTFQRNDSSVLGPAELPASSAWTGGAGVSIARGMLYFTGFQGDTARAPIESSAVNVGVRLRYAFYSTVAENQFSVFVAYNSTTSLEAPGFQIGTKDETSTSIMVNGTGSIHPFVLATRVQYFAQVDMQGRIAVLTLRTGDYAGPILAIQPGQGTAEIPTTADDIMVSATRDVGIEEIEVARYAP